MRFPTVRLPLTMPESRLLDTTELFATLPADLLDELREQATLRAYSRNELVFSQGDPSNELFVVLQGRIAIAQRSADGRESVLAVLEDGELFGDLPLFDTAPRMADARALVDSEVLVLDYAPARSALERHPQLLWPVVRLLARRLRATDEALADAVFLDVPARTAKRLLELADDADEFKLPVTQEELAAMVGASRERVNKALALFARLGWLEAKGRGRYRLTDRQALEDRANL
jgi:CRP/FNR family transcriptional regulator, cyclic AMP receptor protein